MLSDRRVLALILVLVMGAIVAAGVVVVPKLLADDTPEAEVNAQEFLDAWSEGDAEAMAARMVDPPATFALGEVRQDGDLAIASFDARLRVTGVGDWAYQGSMRLEHSGGGDGPDW